MHFIFHPAQRKKKTADNIQLNKEIFGISAHLTANALSRVVMKIKYCKNDKPVCLQVFVVAVLYHRFI